MLKRDDMLELTRRMTPARSSIDRIAVGYIDEEGYIEGTGNIHFLKLSDGEKAKMLKLAKAVPFAETNVQLKEVEFPTDSRESGDMMRLLDAIKESGLKNDALLLTFYEVTGEYLPQGQNHGIYFFHGIYDIPRRGTDKEEQWEAEDVYEYLICAIAPVYEDYVPGEAFCGFLYPSFYYRAADLFHIAFYEKKPGLGAGLLKAIGC